MGAVRIVVTRVVAGIASVVAVAKPLAQNTQGGPSSEGFLSLAIFDDCCNKRDSDNGNQNFFKRHNNHLVLWERTVVCYRHLGADIPSILPQ